ncbi:MAG: protease inhibitor I42 family protein [Bacillota bacterium]
MSLIFLIAIVNVACEESSENRVYTEDNAGELIEVKVGNSFIIELEENPSTGFRWQWAAENDDIIVLESDLFREPKNKDENIVGAAGTHEFVFEAINPGDTALQFEYLRPWEPDNIEKTYIYNIKVKN